jgi:PAS domain S-box-containing protein
MGIVAVSFFAAILVGTFFLVRALREYRESQERFQQMATNIREIFWMIDADSKRALYVNDAYEAITGRSCQSLFENPTSYEELIHPDDRADVLDKLDQATRTGQFNERFRILCTHGEVRWVQVRGFPVRNPAGRIFRLVGTAQEITEQKRAEDQVIENLAMAETARAEAEALRKATLVLTQDLRMDFVMEALLKSLEELIPYTCARVLVPEGGPHVLALGERQIPEPIKTSPKYRPGYPLTLITDESPLLKRVMEERKSVLISDTKDENEWASFNGHTHLRSWLSVPLVASGEYLGCLSVGHTEPNLYSREHLRRAELLAIPAAGAIENARLFTRAEIYASELEKRLVDLREAETALAEAKGEKTLSEAEFQKVFRSSPIAFSITTLREGRFIDINIAFERRYGYPREEVLGRTVYELGMWSDLADRMFMVEQLERGRPVRNVITRLRAKSGEMKLTAYSADRIYFAGQSCILAVSEDLPELDKKKAN